MGIRALLLAAVAGLFALGATGCQTMPGVQG